MRTRMFGKPLRVLGTVAVVIILLGGTTGGARPYGSDALWQIALSLNCNNPASCGSDLGGFWGWIEFDTGGAGDATLTGCGHLRASGPLHQAGADHFNVEITSWTVAAGSAGPFTFIVTGGTMTFTGGTGGRPITVPILGAIDTGIPALPGHYNTAQILGFAPPPGVA